MGVRQAYVGYPATAVPSARTRTFLDKLTYGYTSAEWQRLQTLGGPLRWVDAHLRPGAIADPFMTEVESWFPTLAWSPGDKMARQREGTYNGWEDHWALTAWTLTRRTHSKRQLFEQMVSFWSDHLHVPAQADGWIYRKQYDTMIRRHALGRYTELLTRATLHPAMQMYLGNYANTRHRMNENHGRELLELHSVGRDAGYTEAMVVDSARLLTGYWTDWSGVDAQEYRPSDHYVGPVTVLGFSSDNADADGRAVTAAYLRYLARHPLTARRVCTKLARRFVSDNPPAPLVDAMVATYRSTDTDIRAVIRTMVRHSAFVASAGKKLRTPADDLVAAARAVRVRPLAPGADEDAYVRAQAWFTAGVWPFGWPNPEGPPDTLEAWSSVGRMMASFNMHLSMGGGWIGSASTVRWANPDTLLPAGVPSLRLDALVDHLCRRMMGRPAPAILIRAVETVTGYAAATTVTRDHELTGWLSAQMIAALLDSPTFMRK